MVFELFKGGNLQHYIRKQGPLKEFEAAFLFKSILEGLVYLHEKNIMHRDIKPENILFRSNNQNNKDQIVLADFGLATFSNIEEYLFLRCGTPGYVAPEVYKASHPKDHYSEKCDMFSFGVTLFESLTGGSVHFSKRMWTEENFNFAALLQKYPRFCILSNSG